MIVHSTVRIRSSFGLRERQLLLNILSWILSIRMRTLTGVAPSARPTRSTLGTDSWSKTRTSSGRPGREYVTLTPMGFPLMLSTRVRTRFPRAIRSSEQQQTTHCCQQQQHGQWKLFAGLLLAFCFSWRFAVWSLGFEVSLILHLGLSILAPLFEYICTST